MHFELTVAAIIDLTGKYEAAEFFGTFFKMVYGKQQ